MLVLQYHAACLLCIVILIWILVPIADHRGYCWLRGPSEQDGQLCVNRRLYRQAVRRLPAGGAQDPALSGHGPRLQDTRLPVLHLPHRARVSRSVSRPILHLPHRARVSRSVSRPILHVPHRAWVSRSVSRS